MNILLVSKYSHVEPLGLMALAEVLHEKGHKVDFALIRGSNDDSWIGYDAIGLSVYTGFHKQMFQMADRLLNDTRVIIGGPHATFFSDECLNHASAVVVGEGIQSILYALKANEKIFEPFLVPGENYPTPRREELYERYPEFKQSKIKNVFASMGCPFRCSYCFNDAYSKLYKDYKVRYRTVEAVVEECASLKQYDTKFIVFQDDCFAADMGWLVDFAIDYSTKVKIPFHCHLRPEMVTQGRVEMLKRSGCHGVSLGIETFQESIRETVLNRHFSNEQVYNACKLVKDAGLKLRTLQMLGVPHTSLEDEFAILKMNSEINPELARVSTFTPYLGTKLADHCKAQGFYDGNNDDLPENFFGLSMLNFDNDRKKNTFKLEDIFSTCAKFPGGSHLAQKYIENSIPWADCVKDHLYLECLYRLDDK
jgi:anaerobic magnesium-protoporphyrin IX monomethyl ester cyclase